MVVKMLVEIATGPLPALPHGHRTWALGNRARAGELRLKRLDERAQALELSWIAHMDAILSVLQGSGKRAGWPACPGEQANTHHPLG